MQTASFFFIDRCFFFTRTAIETEYCSIAQLLPPFAQPLKYLLLSFCWQKLFCHLPNMIRISGSPVSSWCGPCGLTITRYFDFIAPCSILVSLVTGSSLLKFSSKLYFNKSSPTYIYQYYCPCHIFAIFMTTSSFHIFSTPCLNSSWTLQLFIKSIPLGPVFTSTERTLNAVDGKKYRFTLIKSITMNSSLNLWTRSS